MEADLPRSPARRGLPLYLRILIAMAAGAGLALLLGPKSSILPLDPAALRASALLFEWLDRLAKLVLRLLSALAPPLILAAIVHALMTAQVGGRKAGRMAGLLVLNTLVAISIGLLVANLVQPGRLSRVEPEPPKPVVARSSDELAQRVIDIVEQQGYQAKPASKDPVSAFLENVPDTLLGPLAATGKTIGVIFIAIALGMALRARRRRPVQTVEDLVQLAFETLLVLLHWVVALAPFMVFGIVASLIAREGFSPFLALGGFVLAVLLALFLQGVYYLIRVKFWSWVCPLDLLRGVRDALVMAFSTASSTATMPVTYECLRTRVKLREENAGLGALVGANFNNDGTALYEAMSALFVAQILGLNLNLGQQLLVVGTSVAASVGAAGIPEAGLVTMTMVFQAVGLPLEYIAILTTVDWFLDRCRTAINVMGDCNVACLLDGREPEIETGAPEPASQDEEPTGCDHDDVRPPAA